MGRCPKSIVWVPSAPTGGSGVTPHRVDLPAPRLRLLCPSAPLSVRDACAFTMIWGSGELKLMVPLSPCHAVAVLPPSVAGGQRAWGSSPVQRALGFLPVPAADAGLLLAGCLSGDDAAVLLPGVLSPSMAKPGVTRPAPAQGPSSVRISGLLSAPILPLNCRPSPEICSIHTFGLEDVAKWLGVACPAMVPWSHMPTQHGGCSLGTKPLGHRVSPARCHWLSCKFPLFGYC